MDLPILAIGMPGSWEWIVIALIALVIFGRRLPEVARSVGKSIVEFKKGLKDVKDDIDVQARLESPPTPKPEPKAEPKAENSATPESSKESASA